jgi:DNA-directed RNA polymerase subunit RPC12/RpoP
MPIQEFPKNPVIKAKVKCVPCGKSFDINEMLKEEALPHPHAGVTEGFLLCPNCGHKVHSFYMPESLRHDQSLLKKAVLRWQNERSISAWTEYVRRQRIFTHNFDRVQEKYKVVFAEEAESEQEST